jgi:hypothetical protein
MRTSDFAGACSRNDSEETERFLKCLKEAWSLWNPPKKQSKTETSLSNQCTSRLNDLRLTITLRNPHSAKSLSESHDIEPVEKHN